MAGYDPYDAPRRGERTSHRYYEERPSRNDPYVATSRDLVPRGREDSDLSVEEIRRDFPPPGYSGSRDVRRARSAEPPAYYDDYDDRRSQYSRGDYDRGYDRDHRSSRKKAGSVYYEEEEKSRRRVLSKQEKLIAAVVGGALAVGSKELYDRRESKQEGTDVHRNPLASAALGAAGALAAYQGAEFYNKKASKESSKTLQVHKGRDGRVSTYYSDEEEDGSKEKKGHKNFLESALAAAGLGGAVKALTGGGDKDDKRSDTRSRRGSRSRSGSRDRGDKGGPGNKIQKAAMASLIAGATEAFRVAKQPGDWKGEKAKRIFTAAAGAATIDAAQNPDKSGSKLGLAESVIGGLLGNRLVNGSKKNIEEDKVTGRSRSRSRAKSDAGGGGGGVSGLAALATAGLGAFGAKKIMDNRERSRSRQRSDSRGSRGGSPDKRHRSRSRSVVDKARSSLAKLGIGNGPDDDRDSRDSPRGSRSHRRRYSDDESDDYSRDRGHGRRRNDYDDDDRSYRGGGQRHRSRSRGGGGRRDRSRGGSDTDLGSSDEDERKAKKMRDRDRRGDDRRR